jgi:hypothetical protein
MGRKASLTLAEIAVIRELRAGGAELHELADLWGVTPQYIRKLTREVKPDREGRRMHWLTKAQILELLDAWRPALPTEGLPLPHWLVRRGMGRFPWSKDGHPQVGRFKKVAHIHVGKLPNKQSALDSGERRE